MREFNDLRKLRHAVGVAQAGSFTAAAQTLSITQSALTKSVAELESILGLALFERLPRGIRLTAHGEEFIRKAQQILGDTHQLMHNLGEIQSLATGQLRVTVTPPALINFIEHATAAFSQVYPGISLQISQASIGDAAKSLLSGEADLAAGPVDALEAWGSLHTKSIAQLNMVIIGRRGHPAANDPELTAAKLLSYPLVMPSIDLAIGEQIRRAYRSAGLPHYSVQYTCDHFPLVKRLVNTTDAITPVVSLGHPGPTLTDEFEVFAGVLPLDAINFGIAYTQPAMQNPATGAYIDLFQSFIDNA